MSFTDQQSRSIANSPAEPFYLVTPLTALRLKAVGYPQESCANAYKIEERKPHVVSFVPGAGTTNPYRDLAAPTADDLWLQLKSLGVEVRIADATSDGRVFATAKEWIEGSFGDTLAEALASLYFVVARKELKDGDHHPAPQSEQ